MEEKAARSAVVRQAKRPELAAAECRGVAQDCPPNDKDVARPLVNGNLARRTTLAPGIYWDRKLVGFGLRVRDSGHRSWIVKYVERGKQKWVTLGTAGEVGAEVARERAAALLVAATLDGLPRRQPGRTAPLFRDYVPEFWRDYAHHWKPSTAKRNRHAIDRHLAPVFGGMALDRITPADVARWRDDMVEQEGSFNRAIPVLAVMLTYAEQLGYRRKGSNPCRGTSRYKRQLPDRYLTATEYRRLAGALQLFEADHQLVVAALRMLLFTGARSAEITDLRWRDVQLPRLVLPDSKTGPKVVHLNSPAMAILATLSAGEPDALVFPRPDAPALPVKLAYVWSCIRRHAALPDLRIHDLRHSFASVAIQDNVPLHTIGKLLGHALPETTARYAHLADEVVADAADRVSGGIAAALGIAA